MPGWEGGQQVAPSGSRPQGQENWQGPRARPSLQSRDVQGSRELMAQRPSERRTMTQDTAPGEAGEGLPAVLSETEEMPEPRGRVEETRGSHLGSWEPWQRRELAWREGPACPGLRMAVGGCFNFIS